MSCTEGRLFGRSEMTLSVRRLCEPGLKDSPCGKLHGQRSGDSSAQSSARVTLRRMDAFVCDDPEERRAQIISFAYGNVKLHNPAVTREDVERIYDELFVRDASTAGGDPARCKSPKSLGAVPS